MTSHFFVYITTNPSRRVLYTGITDSLDQRIIEHYLNRGKADTFAGKYYCYCLIYWEDYLDVRHAIDREKEIKGWVRKKKLELIRKTNPSLNFLNSSIINDWPPKHAQARSK